MKKNNKIDKTDTKVIKRTSLNTPQKKGKIAIYILLVFLLPLLLYTNSINFGLTKFDDDLIISNNISYLKNTDNISKAFTTNAFISKPSVFYRPLQTISYIIDVKLSDINSNWMFHVSNILLLGLISISLFLLLLEFKIDKKLAFLSTMIYCVHPLFVSSIAWIPARGDLFLTLFSLLSFLFFIKFLQTKKNLFLILNWITFTLALYSKETAALMPLIFVIYYFAFNKEKHIEKKHFLILLLYFISGIIWFWMRSKALGVLTNTNDAFGISAVLINIRTIPESLSKFFLIYDITPIPSFSFLKTIFGIIILVGLIYLFFKDKIKKEKLFYLSWFILLMLPPMLYKNQLIDYLDHRFFLPLIGVFIFVLKSIPKKWIEKINNKSYIILIIIIVILSSFTFLKSESYKNPIAFYNSAIAQTSNSAFAYYNRGLLKNEKKDFEGAINDYNKAIINRSNFTIAYYARALAKVKIKDITGAIEDYNIVINLRPNLTEAYLNRGNAKFKINDNSGAVNDYNKAILLDPNNADVYLNRGNARSNLNDNQNALEDYNKAISLNPNNANAYNSIGVLLSKSNLKEAISNFNKALKINPNLLDTYFNRAIARYNLKDFKGTIEDCNKVLQLNPNINDIKELKDSSLKALQN